MKGRVIGLALPLIQILPQQQKHESGDLCAASHTPFYNTINKSGVMNLLVTSSSFSCFRLHPASRQHCHCDCTLIRQWSLWQDQDIGEIQRGTRDWVPVPMLKTPGLEWWLMGNQFDRGQCRCLFDKRSLWITVGGCGGAFVPRKFNSIYFPTPSCCKGQHCNLALACIVSSSRSWIESMLWMSVCSGGSCRDS